MTLNEYYTIENKDWTGKYTNLGTRIVSYDFDFLFETKDEYLAFVQEWKAQYKELSGRLKQAKLNVRDLMRENGAAWREQGHVFSLKGQAHMMLEMRRQGKLAAAEQAQAQREAAA